ncbi:redoxin domain-containing protein [Halosolutus amylolyticus]|uniref:Redoxin domain-containing protein n=1 Tax=Halosolutus amylolyticus TaxID=2932267 RepID=A0ABD5PK28_9EURY|nr:redoxin domain-containing protein [Halosolutus amylolyticus]
METRPTGLGLRFPNVGPGPDPLSLVDLTAPVAPPDPTTVEAPDPAHEAIVVLLHRDHHAGNCRRQVRAVADRYDEFRERGTQVVSVVSEPRHRVREWQARYDLPYPICADPAAEAGEAFDQRVRHGTLGRTFDLLGRMPAAIVLDVRAPGDVAVLATHRGDSIWDRPRIDALLSDVAQRS